MAREISSKRIVLKIGTNALTKADATLNSDYIAALAGDISALAKGGKEIVIVTSGAIGAGCGELGIKSRVRDIQMRQATAAIGQGLLMHQYHIAFGKHKVKVAQILITYDDFSDRKRYLNLRRTLDALLKMGVIPIINENDPISIDEIGPSFGDNDKLAALVASKIEANLLVLMSDIDGLYDKDPKMNKDAKLIPEVRELTREIEAMCGSAGSKFSTGGMISKVNAAKLCNKAGVSVVVCDARKKGVLGRILEGKEEGTLFVPKEKIENKKRWILVAKSRGAIIVDEGAKKALQNGKNLLPAGIKSVKGSFKLGDVIDIECDGKTFSKAISDYASDELEKIKGKKSSEIAMILGYEGYENVTRRENLVML